MPVETGGETYLALALLVTRVLADNHDTTVTANDLALVANLLNAWVNLHVFTTSLGGCITRVLQTSLFKSLFVAINDATSCEVVSAELNDYAVFRKDLDVVLTHFS